MASAEERKLARIRRFIGYGVILATFTFVGFIAYEKHVWTVEVDWGWMAGTVVLSAIVYAAACQPLAWAWALLLHAFGGSAVPVWTACRIFSLTNFAKYLPGHAFQSSSRHALARRAGTPEDSVIYALLAEALFMLLAAFAWIVPFAVFLVWAIKAHGSFYAVAAMVLFIGVALFAGWFLHRSDLFKGVRNAKPGGIRIVRPLFAALAGYLVFFAVSGGLAWLIADRLTGGEAGATVTTFIAVTALSWAVGYVVPGVAAGIGLREAALIAILTQFLAPHHAVIVALAHRLVTVLGDGLFFGAYWAAGKRFFVPRQSAQ